MADKKHSKNITQNDKILRYLETHKKGITPMDALQKFGCFRLSARIADLKEAGFNIYRELEVKEYEDGSTKRYARYFLHS